MANPLREVRDFLAAEAAAGRLPEGTTRDTSFPAQQIGAPHIQFAWDGTPSDADNREDAAVRLTVWTPRGKVIDAQDLAATLRTRLLAWSSANTWRVDRGAGRLPGTDRDTELPFCTFTVTLVLRAASA